MNTAAAESKPKGAEPGKPLWDTVEIMKYLPHRYPFLLVDKIVEFEDAVRIVGIKNVTMNEPFFQGHFPGHPVMPGVLILEAMAQTAALMARLSKDGAARENTIYLVGANDFKWKKMVLPGDTLRIEMSSVKKRRPLWMMSGVVTVDGSVVAQGTLSAIESQ
jgi:3-hydroxyacyl-[acyl-carrier-protein] dehydratase